MTPAEKYLKLQAMAKMCHDLADDIAFEEEKNGRGEEFWQSIDLSEA